MAGQFQLPPAPKKHPFFDWSVMPNVARVRFSVFDTSGDTLLSVPVSGVPVMVAVLLDGTFPFSSPTTRRKLREGNVRPAPHRSAPLGSVYPAGLPSHS